jgi:hypothetical protein
MENVKEDFSFVPEADAYFLVVKHDNILSPTNVALEIYGLPR